MFLFYNYYVSLIIYSVVSFGVYMYFKERYTYSEYYEKVLVTSLISSIFMAGIVPVMEILVPYHDSWEGMTLGLIPAGFWYVVVPIAPILVFMIIQNFFYKLAIYVDYLDENNPEEK